MLKNYGFVIEDSSYSPGKTAWVKKRSETVPVRVCAHLLLGVSVLGVVSCTTTTPLTELYIDGSKTYQEIDGFGASDAWTIDPLIRSWMQDGHEQEIEHLADILFSVDNGIGLTAWRFNIGAGSDEQGDDSQVRLPIMRAQLLQSGPGEPIDTNKQRGQIRMLQEAVERGVPDLIAFSNSPPVWATKNGLTHPFPDTGSTNLRADMTDAFAQFVADVVGYLREREGIPINYVSPVNEPTWEWQNNKQEGNRYNNQELAAVYKAVHMQLARAGLADDVAIEAGEVVEYKAALSDPLFEQYDGKGKPYHGGMNKAGVGTYRNYIELLLGDPHMRDIVGNKLSLHGYFSDAWSKDMGELRDLVWQHSQAVAPGSKLWMSEVCILGGTGDVRTFKGPGWRADDMQFAMHMGKILHRDLTRLNASAWHWWLGVTVGDYKDGLIRVSSDFDDTTIQTSKAMWVLGQYSRFIRPGYQRISLNGADDLDGLMASAYTSPNKQRVVVVAVNVSDVSIPLKLNLSGLANADFEVFQTNAQDSLNAKGTVDSDTAYVLPGESVVTLVGQLPAPAASQ